MEQNAPCFSPHILWIWIILPMYHDFLGPRGLQGTHMDTLKPKKSKWITFTVWEGFFTFWAILAHSACPFPLNIFFDKLTINYYWNCAPLPKMIFLDLPPSLRWNHQNNGRDFPFNFPIDFFLFSNKIANSVCILYRYTKFQHLMKLNLSKRVTFIHSKVYFVTIGWNDL